ncbi:hypothetical protein O0L34_g16881 [Tuta absoluta]|nr:hypothetical protein O0L34_g16881 [Tuta absoluta]
MNILPKKRWHVRTKENIARVRKDEAEAAEKERQEQLRIETADREARLNLLKEKSKQKLEEAGYFTNIEIPETSLPTEHINLFADLDHAVKTTNKEHDEETKNKKEEYEKKIGYLTYLGQDTNEALKKKNWYEVAPESSRFSRTGEIKDTYDKLVLKDADGKPKEKEIDVKDGEVGWKSKQRLDPINAFRKFCPEKPKVQPKPAQSKDNYTKIIESVKHQHKSKKKKQKKDKEDKEKKLQKLREARLKREMQEKRRTELFLKGNVEPTTSAEEQNVSKVKPKYNSQFNPELARQNYR